MRFPIIKYYAVLSSVFTAVLALSWMWGSIDPGLTRSKELYSHLMEMKQDAKQRLKSQSCLITTRFSWCASQAEFEKTPTTIYEPVNGMNWPPSGTTRRSSSQKP